MYNPQITVERITILRNKKNISLNSLNEACNLNKNTIKMSESSKNGLSSAFLYDIANYLDCSVDYLLGRTDNATSYNQDNNSGNIINGSNGNNSPLTVNGAEQLDEMTAELVKAFRSLPFRDRLDVINMVMEKSGK